MPTDAAPQFGDLLRRCRIAARFTQEELAERAGMSVRGLSDLERGIRRVPHRDTLLRIAHALRLETDAQTALETAARQLRAVHVTLAPHATRNLPATPTSFVGRDHDLADVGRLLETTRLLTVTGAGGVGKTRVSIELARNVPGEVLFVDLVSLTEGPQVASTVASTLGILEQPGRSSIEALATALHDKPLLLILDNCEHLVAACADLAQTLIRSCPHLRVLATSREALGVEGELVWTLSPLSLPDPQRSTGPKHFSESEAVRLFVARAQAAQPDFVFDQHTAPPVMKSAFGWTVSHSQLSLRPHGSERSAFNSSYVGWRTGTHSSRSTGAVYQAAIRNCVPRSTGVTNCSLRPSNTCLDDSPSSPVDGRSKLRRPSAGAMGRSPANSSTCTAGWSRSHSSSPVQVRPEPCATGSSSRSASTP